MNPFTSIKSLCFLTIINVIMITGCTCSATKNMIALALNQKTTYYENHPQQFQLINNTIIIPLSVNGEKQNWLFDSRGGGFLFLEDGTWTDTLTRHPLPKFSLERDAAGNSFERSMVVLDSATCNLFTIRNWIVSGINPFLTTCNGIIGIFGGTEFVNGDSSEDVENQILEINFDDSTLCCIRTIPTDLWQPIKAKVSKFGQVSIFLNIEGKEIKFGFDTGYYGDINLAENNNAINELPTEKVTYGNVFISASGIIKDTIIIKKVNNVYLGNRCVTANICIVPKNMNNLVGMEFIQNFNWILDYKNQKVYFQERKTPYIKTESVFRNPEKLGVSFNFSETPMKVRNLVKNGKAEKAGFQLDDIVLKINDINIDEIPPCEREDKIKETIETQPKPIFEIERNGKKIKIRM